MQHKKILGSILSGALLFSLLSSTSFAAEASSIKLQIGSKQGLIDNSKIFTLEYAPYIKKDVTMVPLRFVSENLNAKVDWNQQKKQITITKNENTLLLTVDSTKVLVNGVAKYLEYPATISKNTTFVPLRFVSENLEAIVTWNQTNKTILIQPQVDSDNGSTSGNNSSNGNGNTNNGGSTSTPTPTPVVTPAPSGSNNEQIQQLLTLNAQYYSNEDAVSYNSTFVNPKDSISTLNAYFSKHQEIYSVEDVKNIKVSNNTATATLQRLVEVYEKDGDSTILAKKTRQTISVEFSKVQNVWKINSMTVTKTEQLGIEPSL